MLSELSRERTTGGSDRDVVCEDGTRGQSHCPGVEEWQRGACRSSGESEFMVCSEPKRGAEVTWGGSQTV